MRLGEPTEHANRSGGEPTQQQATPNSERTLSATTATRLSIRKASLYNHPTSGMLAAEPNNIPTNDRLGPARPVGGPAQPSGRSRAAPDRQGKQGAKAEGTGGAVRVSGARAQPERDAKSRGEGGRRRGQEGGPPRP